MRNKYTILVGETGGKRPLARPRHRRQNTKIDLK
jgi:hypothetical protein